MLPRTIQVVLFSATFPAHVYRYAAKFAPDANEITLHHEELTVEGIKQLYMDCSNDEEKYTNLVQLYGLLTVGSSIIFVRVRILHPDNSLVCLLTLSSPDSCFRS
jgi:ATP-dependent RNA helicase DDX19/DBP5